MTSDPRNNEGAFTFVPIRDELRDLERRRMCEALTAAGGNQTRAAALICMPLRTFVTKVKVYGLGVQADSAER
jgi:DNA-binding NtrC family response regulator